MFRLYLTHNFTLSVTKVPSGYFPFMNYYKFIETLSLPVASYQEQYLFSAGVMHENIYIYNHNFNAYKFVSLVGFFLSTVP